MTGTDEVEERHTYKEWFATLETIAADIYLVLMLPDERCIYILPEKNASAGVSPRVKISHKLRGSGSTSRRLDVSTKSPPNIMKSRKKLFRVKIKEIIISLAEPLSVSSDGDDESHSSAELTEEVRSRSSIYRKRRRRSHSDTRSVVTPRSYTMNGKVSLKEFLATSENYFNVKFKEDSHDKNQMLLKFLTGDLLKIYEVWGGRK